MKDMVPTLIDQCEKLDREMDLIDSKEVNAALVRKLESIQVSLEERTNEAVRLKASLSAMRGEKIVSKDDIKIDLQNSRLQKSILTMQKKLADNRSKILEGNTWNNLNQVQAIGSAKLLSTDLSKAWKEYIKLQIPGIATFQSVKVLPKCKKSVEELEGLNDEASELKNKLPSDELEIGRVAQIKVRMAELIDALDLKDVPPEMLDFLKRSSSTGGVSMEDLTDEILAWLRDRRFHENLNISTTRE